MPSNYKFRSNGTFPVKGTVEGAELTVSDDLKSVVFRKGERIIFLKSGDLEIVDTTAVVEIEGEKPKVESTQAPVTPGQPSRPIVNPSQPNKPATATATPVKS